VINDREMKELEILCGDAKLAAEAFRDAVRQTAEKHQLSAPGLSRYVRAKVADRLAKLHAETATLEQMSIQFDAPPPSAGGAGNE